MAVTTPKKIYHAQPTNAATTLYTCAVVETVIRHLRAVTKDTASHTLELWLNGSADVNEITRVITIPASGDWEDDVYIVMANGDTLQGKADVSAKVTLYVGGVEIT